MSTAAVRMHASFGVQPHPLYSISGAVLGTALVCAFLLWAFTNAQPRSVMSQRMVLHLVTLAAAPVQHIVRTIPREARSAKQAGHARLVAIPEASALPQLASPEPLDLSLPNSVFAPPPAPGFIPHAFNPYSDLSQALRAPPSPTSMHNGDAYRSTYGFTVAKSGGRCLVLQTIQTGPSPQAHTTVGFGVPCPGEYRPSMADELKAWADKEARKHHLPE